tara:strand:+ start:306 stop:647 length:342 start_codon:yes stop_codon:yes gene_type:complete
MFPSSFSSPTSVLECAGSGDGQNFYITAVSNAGGEFFTGSLIQTDVGAGSGIGVGYGAGMSGNAATVKVWGNNGSNNSFKVPPNSTLTLPGVGIPAKGFQVDVDNCYLFYYTR